MLKVNLIIWRLANYANCKTGAVNKSPLNLKFEQEE